MAIELEKGRKRTVPFGYHGLRDCGDGGIWGHCIFSSYLGITVVACVLLAPTLVV